MESGSPVGTKKTEHFPVSERFEALNLDTLQQDRYVTNDTYIYIYYRYPPTPAYASARAALGTTGGVERWLLFYPLSRLPFVVPAWRLRFDRLQTPARSSDSTSHLGDG